MTSLESIACRVCGNPVCIVFRGRLLNHEVDYHECRGCQYVQTEYPHWLAQAYGQAINRSDTGILRRNERNARLAIRTLVLLGKMRGCVIDCAGGYGVLVRMLRDRGVDARWSDPYCENLVARGFEAELGSKADLMTAFEALEHFVHPTEELAALLARCDSLLVSTSLIPSPAPAPGSWWYYAPEHGQHIGFYRLRTLKWLADRLGRHLVSDGKSFHLFTREPVPRWRWMLARRTAIWALILAKLRLRSLMWADHRRMSALDASEASKNSNCTPEGR